MGVKVREKHPGEWWVFIVHEGKRRSKKVGRDRRAALEVAKKIEARLVLDGFGFIESRDQEMSFAAYATAWREGYVKTALKASTYRGYECILSKHLIPRFGKQALSDITRDQVKGYLAELNGGKLSIGRIRRIKAALSGIFSNAVEDGKISVNPAARLDKWLKGKDQALGKEINPYTAQELELYLSTVEKHFRSHYPLFLTLARTGCRLGEALGLQWGDLDFNGGFVEVRRALVDGKLTTTKTGKSRRVNATPHLLAVMGELRAKRKQEALKNGWRTVPEWVFVNQAGEPLDAGNVRGRVHYKACERAGLRRIRIHDIRHGYATIRINAGHNIADVSKQLGHESIKITVDTYYRWIENAHSSQVAELDQLGKDASAPSSTLSAPWKKEGVRQSA
jgi:integrase